MPVVIENRRLCRICPDKSALFRSTFELPVIRSESMVRPVPRWGDSGSKHRATDPPASPPAAKSG